MVKMFTVLTVCSCVLFRRYFNDKSVDCVPANICQVWNNCSFFPIWQFDKKIYTRWAKANKVLQ